MYVRAVSVSSCSELAKQRTGMTPLEVSGSLFPCFVDAGHEQSFLGTYYNKCFKLQAWLHLGMVIILGLQALGVPGWVAQRDGTGSQVPAPPIIVPLTICMTQAFAGRIVVHVLIKDMQDARRVGLAILFGTYVTCVLHMLLSDVPHEYIQGGPMALNAMAQMFAGTILGTQGVPGNVKLFVMVGFFLMACISLKTIVALSSYHAMYQQIALISGLGISHVNELSERSLFAINYVLDERSEQLAAEKQRLQYEHSLLRHHAQHLERRLSEMSRSDSQAESQPDEGAGVSRQRRYASPQPHAAAQKRPPARTPTPPPASGARRSKAA